MYIIYIYNYFDKKYLVVMMGVLIVSLIFFGLCNYYSEHSFGMFRKFLGFTILCRFYTL